MKPDASTPRSLGGYRIGRTLGWGGMGVVYAAHDAQGREVALKVLRSSGTGDEEVPQRRFRQEIQTLAALDHPNIVHLLDAGRDGIEDWFAMDLVDGTHLDHWLEDHSGAYLARAELLEQVARAVGHAHQRGILHRDLKPSNVLVDRAGRPWITDFGLARLAGAESSLTHSQEAVGTPHYMSPEQAGGLHQECSPASDVWSLGVMLYTAVTGTTPFHGVGTLEIMGAIVHGTPIPPRRLAPTLPPKLEAIILKCLERDARCRYPDANALADDLQALREGRRISAPSVGPISRFARRLRRRWDLVAIVGVILALAATAVALWLDRSAGQAEERWEIVTRYDLSDPMVDLNGWQFLSGELLQPAAAWTRGEHGLLAPKFDWVWFPERLAGDLRVSVLVRCPAEVDGIELAIGARHAIGFHAGMVPIGHSCQFGGYGGAVDYISRNEDQSGRNASLAVASRVQPSAVQVLSFERRGDRYRIAIDGQTVSTTRFPLPPVGEDLDRIGLRSYAVGLEILELVIEKPAIATRPSPLIAGDALVRAGNLRAAVGEYSELAAGSSDPELVAQARLRAYLTGLRVAQLDPDTLHELRAAVLAPEHSAAIHKAAREADAVAAWSRGDLERAIELIETVQRDDPESPVVRLAIGTRAQSVPEQLQPRLLACLGRNRGIEVLHLDNLDLVSLEGLAGLRLRWLAASHNRIVDLEPLRGMPLATAYLGHNHIADVAPLAGGQLHTLTLDRNPVADLTPLSGLPLRYLSIRDIASSDLRALRGLPLTHLFASHNGIENLAPLTGMPLRQLDLEGNRIVDLTPVAMAPLQDVNVAGNQLATLPIFRQRRLATLDCSDNRITSLQPLADQALRQLHCDRNPLTTLDGPDLASLVELSATDLPLADLTALRNPPPICRFGSLAIPPAALEQAIAWWQTSSQTAGLASDAKRLLAAHRRDRDALAALGVRVGTATVTPLPLLLTRDQAKMLCAELGGRLARIGNQADLDALHRQLPRLPASWIGVELDAGQLRWLDGEAIPQPLHFTGTHHPDTGQVHVLGGQFYRSQLDELRRMVLLELPDTPQP